MFKLLFILFCVLLIPSSGFASVAGEVNKANELYNQGKFDDSLDHYQKALDQDDKSPVVKYDLGTALYKKGDYTKALEYLEQAALDNNIKLKPKTEYNLGNVLYKSGIQKENTSVDQAIKSLQEALGHYGRTITLDPKDQDAQYNEDFVKKEIERLKQKKQQQQQQNNQQKQDQNQQQNQKDNQSQQGQQNQEGQQSQQKQQENRQQAQQNKDQKDRQDQNVKQQNNQNKQSAKAQAEQNQKAIDRKQAEDLLEEYQENEEPKKLLNYMPKKIDDRPVLKDW